MFTSNGFSVYVVLLFIVFTSALLQCVESKKDDDEGGTLVIQNAGGGGGGGDDDDDDDDDGGGGFGGFGAFGGFGGFRRSEGYQEIPATYREMGSNTQPWGQMPMPYSAFGSPEAPMSKSRPRIMPGMSPRSLGLSTNYDIPSRLNGMISRSRLFAPEIDSHNDRRFIPEEDLGMDSYI